MIYTTHSAAETQTLAAKLAAKFKTQGGVIALYGELGAGKTTFVQGFAKALEIKGKILSPTFIILREYPLAEENRLLIHADLYRLKDNLDAKEIGLADFLGNPQNIVIIEWANKLSNPPKNLLNITINKISDEKRQIIINE